MQPGGPVRQSYAGVNFIPPVRNYEFGYSSVDWIGNVQLQEKNSALHPKIPLFQPIIEMFSLETTPCLPVILAS